MKIKDADIVRMTLRDYFAAEAMRFSLFEKTSYESMNDVATHAYEVADAMLKAREAK